MRGDMFLSLIICLVLGISAVPLSHRRRRETDFGCSADQFWNEDVNKCLECSLCENQSKTPGCESCPKACEEGRFWNTDNQQCISCEICRSQPKTPECDRCKQKDLATTPKPEADLKFPFWTWILIILVFVVSLPIALAWYKSRKITTSTVAKPVQEIGNSEGTNNQMLESD